MKLRTTAAACLFTALISAPAWACAVCFGDPESPMAKGAVMGVVVLVGLVGAVLSGIAGVSLFWIQRSHKITRHKPTDSHPS